MVVGLTLGGCEDRRAADVAAIKRSYAEFTTALQQRDYDKATNYISSELLARYSNHQAMIMDYFRAFTAADTAASMQLAPGAWVEFDRKDKSKAFLYPHRAPTVGSGFVQETNGWKITVNVRPIMD
jgi:hypothetical protein